MKQEFFYIIQFLNHNDGLFNETFLCNLPLTYHTARILLNVQVHYQDELYKITYQSTYKTLNNISIQFNE